MPYIIYGKKPKGKRFQALDFSGHPVARLSSARRYDTKEEAENRLKEKTGIDWRTRKPNQNIFEIRKVKE